MTEVSLCDLTLRYPGAAAPALDGLGLTLPAGRIFALVGPSGCGKTTAMKLVAGLLAPDRGAVLFDGQDMGRVPPERRGAVMVFQNHLLFSHLDVAGNVGFGLRMRGLPQAEIAAQVAAMLDLVHLPGFGPRRPADLSGGQAQRVALARALVTRPRVLLLDEPLANLDAHLREDMRVLIAEVQRETGITTLIVTHDQEEATVMADRIALILGGRLRQQGPPDALWQRPADAEVAAFFGARNLYAGRVAGGVFHGPFGPVALPAGAAPADGPAALTFRPEALRPGDGPGEGTVLRGRVTAVRFMGTRTRVTIDLGPATVEADLPPVEAPAPGADFAVILPPGMAWAMPA